MMKGKWTCALGAAVAAVAVQAADLEKDLWFIADFDAPAELDGGALLTNMPQGDGKVSPGYAEGRYGRGYAFLRPTNGIPKASIGTQAPELLKNYPFVSGTFCYWMKTPKHVDLASPCPTILGPVMFDGRILKRWKDSGGWFYLKKGEAARSYEWKHIAFTWDEGTISLYENGRLVDAIRGRKYMKSAKDTHLVNLSVGCGDHKAVPADAVLDDIAIFSRALEEEEIEAIAKSAKGLRDTGTRLIATAVCNPVFFRNEPHAALRLTVIAPKAGTYAVSGSVGGKAIPGGKVAFRQGSNDLDVGFEAARYRAGEYDWAFELRESAAKGLAALPALKRKGKLQIRPRFERDRYTVLSWGPHADVKWMKDLGINAANAHPTEYGLRDELFANDMAFSMRSINWRTYLPLDFSEEKIRAGVRAELEPMRGVHSWTMSLQNTEYYSYSHIPYDGLLKSSWRPWAEKSFGPHLPAPKEIGHSPMHYNWWRKGMNWKDDVPQGVTTNNGINFCYWFYEKGNPMYMGNQLAQKELHALSPGSICWAEPIIEAWNIGAYHDLTADWLYMYYTTDNLEALWSQYGQLRALGKPYMPTPSFFPYHTVGYGVPHPTLKRKDGKPQVQCPLATADEMAVYSYLSIGAVPAHALSFFSPRDWEKAAAAGSVYLTNRYARAGWFCSPDDPPKFAKHFNEKIKPMAEFLQDMPNARAPFAFAYPAENRYIDGWLSQTHVERYKKLAGWYGVPYDVLGEFELTPETMGKYRYVVMPSARIFTPGHDKAIKATPKTTEFIFDGRCPTNMYPKSLHLTAWPEWQKDWRFDRTAEKQVCGPFLDWFTNRIAELRALMPAKSDQDGEFSARTFLKEYNGAKYVMVLNDKRYRDENAIQESILKKDWFRPHVAPQTITTHLPVFAGGATYVFNEPAQKRLFGLADGVRNEATVTRDYGVAEAKLFCLYPKKLAKPQVRLDGKALAIALDDVDGKPAAGRGMVEVTLTDGAGNVRDESGRYVVEKGRRTVPLYVADDDRADFESGSWRATVKDLVTGLSAELKLK